ncbi:hypothetical protein [Allopontixanthobacter confluentis]|nr:hypothetical protein [Allopontixanthobacter confluentis]
MNAYSSDFHVAGIQPAFDAAISDGVQNAFGQQWAALEEAGMAVAVMAGVEAHAAADTSVLRAFPSLIEKTGGWKMELARNGVADLSAFMQPGLAALLAVNARGQDAQPAARALWQEFSKARDALLGLVPTADQP